MMYVTVLRLGATTFAALIAVGLVASLVSRRDRASARALLGVGVVMLVGSILHLLIADLTAPDAALAVTGWELDSTAWVVVGTTAALIAGGLWSVFAFRYAGRSRYVIQVTVAGVIGNSLGAVTIAAFALADPSAIYFQLLTVSFLLAGFLVTVGVFLLVWTSVGQNAFPFREPLVLSAGAVVLLFGSFVAQVFEQPALFPALLSVSGGLSLIAVVHYPVFETPPAARVLGRDRVIEELTDGVLIVDRGGRLRDLNPAAERLFDVSHQSVIGAPLRSLFPGAVDLKELGGATEPRRVEIEGGTTLNVRADPVTDRQGRSFGYLLLCEDVTDRQRREEQLTLLSRFVVDVIRDRMTEVAEKAETHAVESRSAEGASVAKQLWEQTTELTTLVTQTRSIEQTIAEEGMHADSPPELRSVIEDLLESAASESGPDVSIDIPREPFDTTINPPLLEALLTPVLEDVCTHAATQVEVDAVSNEKPGIRISDDRPGPDGSDTEQSDPLSLAVTRLALEQLGGDLSVETSRTDRHRIIVWLPPAVPVGEGQSGTKRGGGR